MKQFSNKTIRILAIETSCDETAAAVISGEITNHKSEIRNPKILSSVVSSQIDLHAKTGGVVPEVASRAHMEAIIPVIKEALSQSISNDKFLISNKISSPNSKKLQTTDYRLRTGDLSQITHVAVTAGPGLIGSLLVGFNTAKSLAYSLGLPIIPVNHIEGHINSALGGEANSYQLTASSFPILALTVSGGHSSLTLMRGHGVYENLGQTLDDAAGEAFDKVAKLLDLGYPGGPAVSKLAEQFRKRNHKSQITNHKQISNYKSKIPNEENLCRSVNKICGGDSPIIFPRPILNDGTFNFSFSGLKTAVLTEVIKLRTKDHELPTGEICAAFEDALVDVLVTKTFRAVRKHKPKGVILAGGVAANRFLRQRLAEELNNLKTKEKLNTELFIPPMELCGDNAAMIGLAAYYHVARGDVKNWNEIAVDSNLRL